MCSKYVNMSLLDNIKTITISKGKVDWGYIDNYLFVDPGFNTGLARCYTRKNFVVFDILELGVSTLWTDEYKYGVLINNFEIFLKCIKPIQIICEDIFFRNSDYRSRAAVASQSLFKTPNLIGSFRAIAYLNSVPFCTIHAHEWKGQLDDKAMKNRVHTKLKKFNSRDNIDNIKSPHICAALGIALHTIGIFSEEN